MTKRIVVAEEIAEAGLDRLRSAGFIVDVQLNKSADELHSSFVLPPWLMLQCWQPANSW
jgi:hypothetical protein